MRTTTARHSDTTIGRRAGAAVAANTYPLGQAASTAQAWQESLHSRAARRAERHRAESAALRAQHKTARALPGRLHQESIR